MASTASPYGLRAVNEIGGLPYAGSTRTFLINPNGATANIYNGTVVALNGGYVEPITETGSDLDPFPAGVVGVFVGCSFVNAQGQQIWSQYYPTGVTGVVTAMVVDDPNVVFQVQADGPVGQVSLGANVFFAAAQTGSTFTGNSTTAVSDAPAPTTGIAFRIVGFASGPNDAFTDLLVKFNPGSHSYTNATGV